MEEKQTELETVNKEHGR